MVEELLKDIIAKEDGRPVTMPALGVITCILVGKAIKGDAKLGIILVDLGLRLDTGAAPDDDEADLPEDSDIIAAALARSKKAGGNG